MLRRLALAILILHLPGCSDSPANNNGPEPDDATDHFALDIRHLARPLNEVGTAVSTTVDDGHVAMLTTPAKRGWLLAQIQHPEPTRGARSLLIMGAFTANGTVVDDATDSWAWVRILYPGSTRISMAEPQTLPALNGLQVALNESHWAGGMQAIIDGNVSVEDANASNVMVLVAYQAPLLADAFTFAFAWHDGHRDEADASYAWAAEQTAGRQVVGLDVVAQGSQASLGYFRSQHITPSMRLPRGQTGPITLNLTQLSPPGLPPAVDFELRIAHPAMPPGFAESWFRMEWRGPFTDIDVQYHGSRETTLASMQGGLHLPSSYWVQDNASPGASFTYSVQGAVMATLDNPTYHVTAVSLNTDLDFEALGLGLDYRWDAVS